jgi:NitT/TauT family transport system permease protein
MKNAPSRRPAYFLLAAARAVRSSAMPLAAFLAFGIVWAAAVRLFKVPPILLPGPLVVLDAALKNADVLLTAAASTVTDIILAMVIAVVAGFATAVLIGISPWLRRMIFPYILMTQVVPKVALAPILIAWFGIGMQSRLILAFLIAYFPMVINTLAGVLATSEMNLRYARSLAASDWQILRKVQLPSALPSIMGGIKITAALAVVGIVVGEFVATEGGLGKVIIDATAVLDTALTIAATLIIAGIGLALLGLVELAEHRVIYWQVGR